MPHKSGRSRSRSRRKAPRRSYRVSRRRPAPKKSRSRRPAVRKSRPATRVVKTPRLNCSERAAMHLVQLDAYDMYRHQNGVGGLSFVAKYKQPTWRRGDVITFSNSESYGYRNRGKVFWTGTKAIYPDNRQYEDSMTIPKEFPVCKEFHALYWADVWDSNYPYFYPVIPANTKKHLQNNWAQWKQGKFPADTIMWTDAETGIQWRVTNADLTFPLITAKTGLYGWKETDPSCYTLYTVEHL